MTNWDIYEITAATSSLNGVMLRGRIRKYGIDHSIELLVENTEDRQNGVRFAVQNDRAATEIRQYVTSIIHDATIELTLKNVINPVLSKLKVNDASRYNL